MKVFLIRHGQTTSDVEGRYGGDYDDHLTDLGKKQAEELASELRDLGVEAIFSSNLIRARETAEILQTKTGAETLSEANLRERNLYGSLTGMIKSEAREKYPDLVERIKNTQDTIEGAEMASDFVRRIASAFNKIIHTDYKVVAIVTHGGVIRRILWEFFDIKKESSEIKIDDCAYIEIETDGDLHKIVKMNGVQVLD